MGRTRASLSRISYKKVDGVYYIILPPMLYKGQHTFPNRVTGKLWHALTIFISALTKLPYFLLIIKRVNMVVIYGFWYAPLALVSRLFGRPAFLGQFTFQPQWGSLLPDSRRISLRLLFWLAILNCFSGIITSSSILITPSGSVINNEHLLKKILGGKKVHCVPLGINLSLFDHVKPNPFLLKLKQLGFKIIVCPRRLVPEKGVQYLLEAVPEVLHKHKKTIFIFTGSGPLLEVLQKKAKVLSIVGNVIFTGNIPYASVLEFIKAADIVVVPSVSEENFGMAILEAYALGKPVIGTRLGGIPLVIKDGKSGLLVNPASSQQLSKAIVKLLSSKDLRKTLSNYGRRLVETRFNISNVSKELFRIYWSLIGVR